MSAIYPIGTMPAQVVVREEDAEKAKVDATVAAQIERQELPEVPEALVLYGCGAVGPPTGLGRTLSAGRIRLRPAFRERHSAIPRKLTPYS